MAAPIPARKPLILAPVEGAGILDSLFSSLDKYASTAVVLSDKYSSIKNNLKRPRGLENPTQAQIETNAANSVFENIAPSKNVQTLLLISGVVLAGVGVVYLVKR